MPQYSCILLILIETFRPGAVLRSPRTLGPQASRYNYVAKWIRRWMGHPRGGARGMMRHRLEAPWWSTPRSESSAWGLQRSVLVRWWPWRAYLHHCALGRALDRAARQPSRGPRRRRNPASLRPLSRRPRSLVRHRPSRSPLRRRLRTRRPRPSRLPHRPNHPARNEAVGATRTARSCRPHRAAAIRAATSGAKQPTARTSSGCKTSTPASNVIRLPTSIAPAVRTLLRPAVGTWAPAPCAEAASAPCAEMPAYQCPAGTHV